MIDVTTIIVNYNTAHLIDRAVSKLRESAGSLKLQICIVDNASRDSSAKQIRETLPDCELVENTSNVGFGRANNQMLNSALGRYVLLLNTDAFVSDDSLTKTVAYMDAHPACGVLGVKLIGEDGDFQPSCRYFPTPWNVFLSRTGLGRFFPATRMVDDLLWSHDSIRECDWVPGCYYLVRKECIDQVGLFDPLYFLYYEEVDHCKVAKAAGWKVVFFPDTVVVHLGGESAKSDAKLTQAGRQISELQIESELLYFRKHHGLFGLWMSICLAAMAEIILYLKSLMRRFTSDSAAPFSREFARRWSILRATSWATRPTR